MIMRRKESQAAVPFDQMLHGSTSNRSSVERRCTSAELVHNDQRPAGGATKGGGCLGELHEEGRLTKEDAVAGTKTSKDAVDGGKTALFRRYEATDLCEDGNQTSLAQKRRLATL